MTTDNETLVSPEDMKSTPGGGAAFNGSADDAIGGLLLRAGKFKQGDLERVLKLQKEKNLRFGEAAIQLRLATEKDIQRALAQQYQYPYVADAKSLSPKLVAAIDPFSPETEALRAARTQLLLGWFSAGRKFLAVGAPSEREDSGALAANLAVLFAQLGKKTLLIDANLKQPGLHSLFKLGNASGLSELLAGRMQHPATSAVQPFQTLSLLSAGSPPPNPSELLLRASFDFLFDETLQAFDVVLIDTPSAQTSADFQIIAARAVGMLIAARRNVSRVNDLADMKAKILATGAEIVGAVMTA